MWIFGTTKRRRLLVEGLQEVKVRRTDAGWYFSGICENCHARINQSNARLIAV